jgi:hypothetical protein
MKKILLLFVIAALILSGCFDSSTNNKTNPVAATQLNPGINSQSSPTIDTQSNSLSSNKNFPINAANGFLFTVFKPIDGNKGGEIVLNQIRDDIHAFAKLNIPKNAFNGCVTISIFVDPLTASISFTPAMSFKRSLTLDASIKGLDLKAMNLDSNNVGFFYFAGKGSKVPVKNHGASADLILRKLSVKGAVIKHFSRYGWAK